MSEKAHAEHRLPFPPGIAVEDLPQSLLPSILPLLLVLFSPKTVHSPQLELTGESRTSALHSTSKRDTKQHAHAWMLHPPSSAERSFGVQLLAGTGSCATQAACTVLKFDLHVSLAIILHADDSNLILGGGGGGGGILQPLA